MACSVRMHSTQISSKIERTRSRAHACMVHKHTWADAGPLLQGNPRGSPGKRKSGGAGATQQAGAGESGVAYGREARLRNAARTNPADFLGEDFMNRLKSVQQDTKLSLNEHKAGKATRGQDPLLGETLTKSKRMSAESADGGMSELNSLYAVVQEIKKDLSLMAPPASRTKAAASAAAHPLPQEPSTVAPDLLGSMAREKPGAQAGDAGERRREAGARRPSAAPHAGRLALPEPDEDLAGARSGMIGGAGAGDGRGPDFPAARSPGDIIAPPVPLGVPIGRAAARDSSHASHSSHVTRGPRVAQASRSPVLNSMPVAKARSPTLAPRVSSERQEAYYSGAPPAIPFTSQGHGSYATESSGAATRGAVNQNGHQAGSSAAGAAAGGSGVVSADTRAAGVRAPSLTVPKLNLATLAPAPAVVMPQSGDLSGQEEDEEWASDDDEVCERAHAPHRSASMGAAVQTNGSDWESAVLPPPQPPVPVLMMKQQEKAQRTAAPRAPAVQLPVPPEVDDLQTFGNDWDPPQPRPVQPLAQMLPRQSPAGAFSPSDIVSDIVSDSVAPVAAEASVTAMPAVLVAPPSREEALKAATAELLRAAATEPANKNKAPLSGGGGGGGTEGGVNDMIGVKMTLEEDYAQLLKTPAKRQQMERMIKEDVADALRVPRTRIQVVALEQGSIVALLNILPSERKNAGVATVPTPNELADMLIAQVADSDSKLRRAMSTRRASKVVKCAPLQPSCDGVPSTQAIMTPLKPVPKDAITEGNDIVDSAAVGTPLTEGKSILDRMSMFRELERKSGSVPKPQSRVERGPHFSAPKAALQAHVSRQKDRQRDTGDEESRDVSRVKAAGDESSFPLLSPPTNPNFSAVSMDETAYFNDFLKDVLQPQDANAAAITPLPRHPPPTEHLPMPYESPRSPDLSASKFGVVLSSPSKGALSPPLGGATALQFPTPERSPGAHAAEDDDAQTPNPFGIKLKKVPKKYEETPVRSPRDRDMAPGISPLSSSAPGKWPSPALPQPDSHKFKIPSFEMEEEGKAAAATEVPQQLLATAGGAAAATPEVALESADMDDILAQFGLSSDPAAAPAPTKAAEPPAAAVAVTDLGKQEMAEEEQFTSIPSFTGDGAMPNFADAATAPALSGRGEHEAMAHTPLKAEEGLSDVGLSNLFSPLVVSADDMGHFNHGAESAQVALDACDGLEKPAAPEPWAVADRAAEANNMEQPDQSLVPGVADARAGEPHMAADALMSAGPTASHSRADEESEIVSEAVPGAYEPFADADTVGVQLTLDADYDHVMCEWQQVAARSSGGAATPEDAKAAFAEQMAADLTTTLRVAKGRISVVDLQRGSIIASVNLSKGEGPTPAELADMLVQQWANREPTIFKSATLSTCSSVTRAKAFEPSACLAPAHRKLDASSTAQHSPEPCDADGVQAPHEHKQQPDQPRPTRPKRPILHEPPPPGVVVRKRRADVTPLVRFLVRPSDTEASPGWISSLQWGSELLVKLAQGTLTYSTATEEQGHQACPSSETHRRVHVELHNRRQAPGRSGRVGHDDVKAAVVAASVDAHPPLSAFLWAIFSLVTVELCVREMMVWLYNCSAFASRQQIRECLALTSTSSLPATAQGSPSELSDLDSPGVGGRQIWEGAVLVASIGAALCVQWLFLCKAWHERGVCAIEGTSGLLSFVYQKALSSRLWLGEFERQPSLAQDKPALWCGADRAAIRAAEEGRKEAAPADAHERAASHVTDVLFNDVAQLAEAESYRDLTYASYFLVVGALGLMFREVELSAFGGVCALVVVFGFMALLLSAASSSSISCDNLRLARLLETTRCAFVCVCVCVCM